MAKTKVSEKMLEDWICENPETLPWRHAEIIGRQIPLRHGILDVLAWDRRTIAMELKARPIKEQDIGQVLRYKHCLMTELQQIGFDEGPPSPHCESLTFRKMTYSHLWDEHHGHADNGIRGIVAVLVGSSIDEKTWVAAYEANVNVWSWKYHETQCRFSFGIEHFDFNFESSAHYPSWLLAIHERIKAIIDPETEDVFMENIADLFGMTYNRWEK